MGCAGHKGEERDWGPDREQEGAGEGRRPSLRRPPRGGSPVTFYVLVAQSLFTRFTSQSLKPSICKTEIKITHTFWFSQQSCGAGPAKSHIIIAYEEMEAQRDPVTQPLRGRADLTQPVRLQSPTLNHYTMLPNFTTHGSLPSQLPLFNASLLRILSDPD